MINFTSNSVQETESFATELAGKLRSGDIIAFRGGMGAGKTAFTRGLVSGLGIDADQVSSPTFSLVNEYHGDLTVYHFDMYRITNEESLYFTGFFDYLNCKCIILIEWSEQIQEFLPEGTIVITIKATGETTRQITVQGDERF